MENNKRARTFTGCWTCRLRKRRCDLIKPICSLCEKRGDHCSYDIKLIWQSANMLNQVTSNTTNRRKYTGKRLSRTKFKQIMELEGNNEFESIKKNDNSFTISIRRFQVYDNCVKSVYGNNKNQRCYTNNIVDKKLDNLLYNLQSQIENKYTIDFKSGPFNAFPSSNEQNKLVLDNNSHSDDFESEATLTSTIFSQLDSPEPFLGFYDYNPTRSIGTTYTTHSLPNENLQFRDKLAQFITTNCPRNMVLGRELYLNWFVNHVESHLNYDYNTIINRIMDRKENITIADILLDVPNIDLQIICLTIFLIVNCKDEKINLTCLENWIINRTTLSYNMYPLINYIIKNTQDLRILNHSHQLIANAAVLHEDIYQGELNAEINVSVESRLVCKWKDKILQQLYQGLDTTNSCSQLKYWEKELQFNEHVYRDIYL